ncbi:hypothetical protein CAOG_08679 [Capsaspora owczarzaki ATCC 30864]|uniref:DUF4326 domain-containing protein n=1 Tax=Capsaspora owczarzaki (strain ATCC 30864) TaxID=595528 RepID=A0A0D2VP90_CAPO3|nr:hypothetical protein CAOG_08679 [Capsaspora owczarzaki ATCC 30864]KJE92242.1 hypothetical protein CAOG_008679 [Capsaspora owczarzaki ATCC 30864]|eukprot:XP_011270290.1 hypothetical protein CAOG_08679 [Capsaspora owczarzaki ATCC 30864]
MQVSRKPRSQNRPANPPAAAVNSPAAAVNPPAVAAAPAPAHPAAAPVLPVAAQTSSSATAPQRTAGAWSSPKSFAQIVGASQSTPPAPKEHQQPSAAPQKNSRDALTSSPATTNAATASTSAAAASSSGNNATLASSSASPSASPTTTKKLQIVNLKRGMGTIGTATYPTIETWLADPSNAYVGRKTYVTPHTPFGNPFKVNHEGERARRIEMYREHLLTTPGLLELAKAELRGKNLGCWCHPLACHSDVLMELVNQD